MPKFNYKIFSGIIAALLVYTFLSLFSHCDPAVAKMAAVAVLMAVWWLTEAVHMAVTALLPVVLLPVLGILDSKTTCMQYMDPIIFLFIGGFIIAFAVEKWMLHERLALKILSRTGSGASNILLGVMLTAYFISMWISNTATVMMLYSCVMAIVYRMEKHEESGRAAKLATALLIGLAYAANIGGMGTLVGTPTNMIFYREYQSAFPENHDVNFFSWFVIAFPISLLLMFATYFILKKLFIEKGTNLVLDKNYFKDAYNKLGVFSYEEKIISFIFFTTAVLWFTRSDIAFGSFTFKGWANLFAKPDLLNDSTVAVFMAVLLFFIPSKTHKGKALIGWEDASKLPFDIILLFGGGFALAKGMESSGLSNWLAAHLGFVAGVNIYFFIGVLCLFVTIISEFASNVACI